MSRRTGIIVLGAAIVALSALYAVNLPTTIDGFTLGGIVKCSGGITPISERPAGISCGGLGRMAEATLDRRDPGHAKVVGFEMYMDGTQPPPFDFTRPGVPPTTDPRHPGPDVTVYVFTLADGSKRATGVVCGKEGSGEPTWCVGVGSYPTK